MKKLLLILVVFCIATTTVSAQAVSEAKIRQQIEAAAASMKTMQCDFVQTKYLRMLNDKMVSRGKMYYQQSDKLRWEYTSPYAYAFVLNGSRVLISKGNRNDVINVNQSKFFKEIARIMMNSVVGKVSLHQPPNTLLFSIHSRSRCSRCSRRLSFISTANGQWLLRLSL